MKTVYEPGFEHGPWGVGDPERYSWVAANCFSEIVSSEPVQCKPDAVPDAIDAIREHCPEWLEYLNQSMTVIKVFDSAGHLVSTTTFDD